VFAVQSGLNTALALVLFMTLARVIPRPEMGIYAGLTITYGLFQTVGAMGLNVAAAHFIPRLYTMRC
jgi:O-antigen/teichoic acid export membrane protein